MMPLAAVIDWAALLRTAVIGLVVGAGVVSVYSVGLVGVDRYTTLRTGLPRAAGLALAVACFGVCVGAVVVGILLMVQKTGG
jgi:hypothetical protein